MCLNFVNANGLETRQNLMSSNGRKGEHLSSCCSPRNWAEFCGLKDGEVLISELTTFNSFMCHTKINKNSFVKRHTFHNVSDNDLKLVSIFHERENYV